ncbi:STAS domain-containing protein [Streptomyces sp. NBC_00691]
MTANSQLQARRELAAACERTRPRVVLDLQQVSFMGSSGINTLIRTHRTLTTAEGWLRLAVPSQAVIRVITIVGIDAFIDCRKSLPSALAA